MNYPTRAAEPQPEPEPEPQPESRTKNYVAEFSDKNIMEHWATDAASSPDAVSRNRSVQSRRIAAECFKNTRDFSV